MDVVEDDDAARCAGIRTGIAVGIRTDSPPGQPRANSTKHRLLVGVGEIRSRHVGPGVAEQLTRRGGPAQRLGAGDPLPGAFGHLGQQPQQAGLTQARIPGDLQHRAPARSQRLDRDRQAVDLSFPPDQCLPGLWRTRREHAHLPEGCRSLTLAMDSSHRF
ncbi:MAG: hypothetical protein JF587_16400 [Catenulisporales bacterium]|nr:hypothetical protein [Catenulisporales bacterium]